MAVIRLFCTLLVAASVAVAGLPAPSARAAGGHRWSIVHVYPHKSGAWTEGLAFRYGVLYETTGLYGRSSLRRVDLATGHIMRIRRLSGTLFAEGLTFLDGKAWVLTWKENRVRLFNPARFGRVGRFTYAGEGWGLTTNGRRLVMSNGTSRIRFRDPSTFRITRHIDVTQAGRPVDRLNELEWINGQIWANIWLLPHIVVIDPSNGNVVDRIDFSALLEREKARGDPRDMNGIAYLKSQDRLFVTGKFWKHLYEVQVTAP